jgi:hypothetical protein
VEIKSFEEQKPVVKKLFIEDWKREGYAYQTAFEGELYHLVKHKGKTDLQVEFNQRNIPEPKPKSPTKDFNKMNERRQKLLSLNESRFESINKDPIHITTVPRVKNVNFKKALPRQDLFNVTSTSVFYDFKADINMRRLDAGIPNLTKLKARPDLTVTSLDSCVSVDNVIRAKTQRLKPKVLTLTNFNKTPARDE